MGSTKVIFCVTALLLGTVSANAGFFDTLNKVANTADNVTDTANRVVETQKALAEGKLPTAALKGGKGAKGAKQASKGSRKKK